MDNIISEDYTSELKSFIANLVDFGVLKENSILLLRTPNGQLGYRDIEKIRPLLPKGVLIWLLGYKDEISMESLSEKEMNRHGWYKKNE